MADPTTQTLARAQQLVVRHRFGEAEKLLKPLVKKHPRNVTALRLLAVAQIEGGSPESGVRNLKKAVQLKPKDVDALCDLAEAQRALLKLDDAQATYEKALAQAPDSAWVLGAYAEFLQFSGRHDRACELVDDAIKRHPNDVRLLSAFASLAPKMKRSEEAATMLAAALEQNGIPPQVLKLGCFRLSRLYDRMGEYERAWQAAERGSQAHPIPFNASAHAASVDRMIDAWSPEAIERMPVSRERSEQPVFIVGMPRSGTSLVEQIIDAHPDATGISEVSELARVARNIRGPSAMVPPHLDEIDGITQQSLDRGARDYLFSVYKLAGKADRIADKKLDNFLQLGLISRMLPGSRVIHCTRHPLDNAVSCYLHDFHGEMAWSYDLDGIASYYHDYRRLMAHWNSVLDHAVLEVPYESLVADQEQWTRRIVEFLALPFDERCLRFFESDRVNPTLSNEQVRRPIYASAMGRRGNYERQLTPLAERLEEMGYL